MRVLVTSALMRNRDGNVTTKPDNRLSVNVESMFRLVNFRSDTTEVPMKSLTNSPHQELVWSQPQLAARFYELRDDCDLYATLKWERSTGSLAHGESDDGKWSFKRSGFLRPRVIVRELGSSSDLATFEAGWAGAVSCCLPMDMVTTGGSEVFGTMSGRSRTNVAKLSRSFRQSFFD